MKRKLLLENIPGVAVAIDKKTPLKNALMRNSISRMLVSEASFIKSSVRPRGLHLTTADGRLSYIRIGKAASTALSKCVLKDRLPSLPQHLTPEQINALADAFQEHTVTGLKNGAVIFTVVRNPFSRIVSVYREFFESREGPFLYEDYLFGILRRDFSFRDLVAAVNRIPDTLKDRHFRPQHQLLSYYDDRNIAVDVLKFEDGAEIANYLAARGLTLEDVHRSEPYDYIRYYNLETLELVRTIYEGDILRFGYGAVYEDLKSIIEQRRVQIRTKTGQ